MFKEEQIINGFKLIKKSLKQKYWLAEHICGEISEFRIDQITKQKYCKGCIKNYHEKNKGMNHHSWKGYGEISSDYFTILKHSATDRNYKFDVDIEYLWDIFLKQNKKCALSNLDIYMNEKCDEKKYKTATLDRIDSKYGYIKGNVQWVHRDINKMKNNFPEDYLIKMCELVYKNSQINNFKLNPKAFYKNGNFIEINK